MKAVAVKFTRAKRKNKDTVYVVLAAIRVVTLSKGRKCPNVTPSIFICSL